MQEHHELKNGLFVIGEINECPVGYLASHERSMNAVVPPCVIDVRTEELGMRGSAVIHITEEIYPARVDDLLPDLAEVRGKGLDPLFVRRS